MSLPYLVPIFVKLQQRRCVVVGGGPIAAQKARSLVEAGAMVVVVSPALDPEAWAGLASQVEHVARPFARGDCAGAALVISATADDAVDATVVDDARAAGTLVNTVDVPHRCDFYFGSVVRRGPVTVAISSSGASPSVAVALRKRVEQTLHADIGLLTEILGERRAGLLEAFPDFTARATKLNGAVEQALARLAEQNTPVSTHALHRWVDAMQQCPRDCSGTCCALACLADGQNEQRPEWLS